MPVTPVTAVILAAGGSTRMGRPKALLDVGGEPLIVRHVGVFLAMRLPVRVVLGGHGEAIAAVLPAEVERVWNVDWAATAMSDSARLGVAGLGAALVMPVDLPPPEAATILALLACEGDAVVQFAGQDGHPVRIDGGFEGRLDARLRAAARISVADPSCVLNLNTPEQWAAWRHSRDKQRDD